MYKLLIPTSYVFSLENWVVVVSGLDISNNEFWRLRAHRASVSRQNDL